MSEHQQIAALEERLRLAEESIKFMTESMTTLIAGADVAARNAIKLTDTVRELAMLVSVQQDTIESLQKLLEVG